MSERHAQDRSARFFCDAEQIVAMTSVFSGFYSERSLCTLYLTQSFVLVPSVLLLA